MLVNIKYKTDKRNVSEKIIADKLAIENDMIIITVVSTLELLKFNLHDVISLETIRRVR